mmetsp:Transcript_29811/g.74964  ORF Transcript_29811/g.74964 Transcript_29811/m.74964 type:complete len:245 (+) Transcript_29811:270-1004(+)
MKQQRMLTNPSFKSNVAFEHVPEGERLVVGTLPHGQVVHGCVQYSEHMLRGWEWDGTVELTSEYRQQSSAVAQRPLSKTAVHHMKVVVRITVAAHKVISKQMVHLRIHTLLSWPATTPTPVGNSDLGIDCSQLFLELAQELSMPRQEEIALVRPVQAIFAQTILLRLIHTLELVQHRAVSDLRVGDGVQQHKLIIDAERLHAVDRSHETINLGAGHVHLVLAQAQRTGVGVRIAEGTLLVRALT